MNISGKEQDQIINNFFMESLVSVDFDRDKIHMCVKLCLQK